jgi:hypothetical protein
MANCNTAPQWIFGRGSPFPVPGPIEMTTGWLEPRYEIKIGTSQPYQKNPIVDSFTKYYSYLRDPPPNGFPASITLSYMVGIWPYMSYAFGNLSMRQEWIINRLQDAYEESSPNLITEAEMKGLINNRIDSTAYYLQRIQYDSSPTSLNWFQAARAYLDTQVLPRKTQVLDLMTEFEGWASASGENASLLVSPESTYKQTPIKWTLFWYEFREKGKLTTLTGLLEMLDLGLYRKPYRRNYWPDVRDNNSLPEGAIADVRTALKDAAVRTVENSAPLGSKMLDDVVRIRTPFLDGAEYGVAASDRSLKITGFLRWLVAPSPSAAPKMEVGLQSFLPILVRFTASGSISERKVWLMSYNVVSDNLGLPEWGNPTLLQRYKNSIKKSAEGTLTELMLDESQLLDMNAYPITVYYNPPWNGPIRR